MATFKEAMVKLMADGNRSLRALRLFLLDYRSTPHTTTGETPAKLFLRRELRTEVDAYFVDWERRATKTRQKTTFDKRAGRDRIFRVGQPVWAPNPSPNSLEKFRPGLVLALLGTVMYDVEVDGVVRTYHADQLRERRILLPRGNTRAADTPVAALVSIGVEETICPDEPIPSCCLPPTAHRWPQAGNVLQAVGGELHH